MRQKGDIRIAKMRAAGENAAQQDVRVHRRHFRIPNPFAGVDIGPVIQETTMMWKLMGKKIQGADDPQPSFGAGQKSSLIGDTKRGKAKSGGGDAGDVRGIA